MSGPLISQFSEIKVIYFDLDDTLCAYWDAAKSGLKAAFLAHPEHGQSLQDIQSSWALCFREFVETIGKTHWYEKYKKSGEITRIELMRRTLERLDIYDDELAQNLSLTYHIERQAALSLFPEALEVLQVLKSHYTLGLITNGPADIQRLEIQKLNIEEFFGPIFIEGEVGFGKPDPRVLQMAQDKVGCQPHEILFVGNSYHHDIVPAQVANWKTVWIRRDSDVSPSSRTGKPDKLPEGATPPDLTITDLRQLLA